MCPPPQSHHHNGSSGFPGYQPPRVPMKSAAADTTPAVRTRKVGHYNQTQPPQHNLMLQTNTPHNDRSIKVHTTTTVAAAVKRTAHEVGAGLPPQSSTAVPTISSSGHNTTVTNHHTAVTSGGSALSTNSSTASSTNAAHQHASASSTGRHLSALVGKLRLGALLKPHNGTVTGSEQPLASSRKKQNQQLSTLKPPVSSKHKSVDSNRSVGVEDVSGSGAGNHSTHSTTASAVGGGLTRGNSAVHKQYLKLYFKKFDVEELEVLKKIYKELCER
eukprot:Lankesteria_metandrocarpae@DN4321_c0_g1_i2.p2